MLSTEDARTAVARGAALLDEKAPGWRDRINLDELVMSDCFQCILGQVMGGYFRARVRLFPELPHMEELGAAIRHGFDVPQGRFYSDDDYLVLKKAWVDHLLEKGREHAS